jgi:hypothetical protein
LDAWGPATSAIVPEVGGFVAIETLTEPDLHDGVVFLVAVDHDTKLVVRGRHVDGYLVDLQSTGLLDLKVDNFRAGNIVGDVTVYSGEDCPVPLIELLCNHDAEWVERKRVMLTQGQGRLFGIECSYGCTLVAHFTGEITLNLVPDSATRSTERSNQE